MENEKIREVFRKSSLKDIDEAKKFVEAFEMFIKDNAKEYDPRLQTDDFYEKIKKEVNDSLNYQENYRFLNIFSDSVLEYELKVEYALMIIENTVNHKYLKPSKPTFIRRKINYNPLITAFSSYFFLVILYGIFRFVECDNLYQLCYFLISMVAIEQLIFAFFRTTNALIGVSRSEIFGILSISFFFPFFLYNFIYPNSVLIIFKVYFIYMGFRYLLDFLFRKFTKPKGGSFNV